MLLTKSTQSGSKTNQGILWGRYDGRQDESDAAAGVAANNGPLSNPPAIFLLRTVGDLVYGSTGSICDVA